ncbi:MAG TPA: VOC family protein [Pirellulaceae bacterium]|nr:VOC family protein [Pirellulaceae bacterium]
MQARISMITLGVADLERSIAFYEQGLQFPRRPTSAPVAFFTLSGTWLALYGHEALAEDAGVAPQSSGFRGITLAHNVSTKAEVVSVLEQAAAAGGKIIKPAQDAFWGGYYGYFADPDGHLWEVAWNFEFWPGPADMA